MLKLSTKNIAFFELEELIDQINFNYDIEFDPITEDELIDAASLSSYLYIETGLISNVNQLDEHAEDINVVVIETAIKNKVITNMEDFKYYLAQANFKLKDEKDWQDYCRCILIALECNLFSSKNAKEFMWFLGRIQSNTEQPDFYAYSEVYAEVIARAIHKNVLRDKAIIIRSLKHVAECVTAYTKIFISIREKKLFEYSFDLLKVFNNIPIKDINSRVKFYVSIIPLAIEFDYFNSIEELAGFIRPGVLANIITETYDYLDEQERLDENSNQNDFDCEYRLDKAMLRIIDVVMGKLVKSSADLMRFMDYVESPLRKYIVVEKALAHNIIKTYAELKDVLVLCAIRPEAEMGVLLSYYGMSYADVMDFKTWYYPEEDELEIEFPFLHMDQFKHFRVLIEYSKMLILLRAYQNKLILTRPPVEKLLSKIRDLQWNKYLEGQMALSFMYVTLLKTALDTGVIKKKKAIMKYLIKVMQDIYFDYFSDVREILVLGLNRIKKSSSL